MGRLSALLWVAWLCSGCTVHAWHQGVASWYGRNYAGKPTASGERFKPSRMTAAHRTLPFGTVVLVTRGDRKVRVRINDRGPFAPGRELDLSRAAARKLQMIDDGVARVQWREVGCKPTHGQGPQGCVRK